MRAAVVAVAKDGTTSDSRLEGGLLVLGLASTVYQNGRVDVTHWHHRLVLRGSA